ncbi:MAG TPA: hypothetical protein PKE20_02650 [Promineifilum sp.]|nr:hypothetical protein [Promineifilum sp.]
MEEYNPVEIASADNPQKIKGETRGCLIAPLALLILLAVVWFLVRPGVFTVQPIGAIPGGVTIIYHSRGPQMPLFSSPDGICLEIQGSVTLFCRMAAFAAVEEITDRIIVRLPYIEMAYLISTGGSSFEQ